MKLTNNYLLLSVAILMASSLVGATPDHELEEKAAAGQDKLFLRASPLLEELQHLNLEHNIVHSSTDIDPSEAACVSFFKYSDTHCMYGPIHKITFTTSYRKGSPCVPSVNSTHYSFKDQYCDLAKNEWHETEYTHSNHCHEKWPYKWLYPPLKLKFTRDTCVGGYNLDYCKVGACPNTTTTGGVVEETVMES